jgi:hypothetical protein
MFTPQEWITKRGMRGGVEEACNCLKLKELLDEQGGRVFIARLMKCVRHFLNPQMIAQEEHIAKRFKMSHAFWCQTVRVITASKYEVSVFHRLRGFEVRKKGKRVLAISHFDHLEER